MVYASSEIQSLSNTQLTNIYTAWNIYSQNDLPLTTPLKQTPFEYLSIKNDDASMFSNPRLSVTKLLVSGWCELREYYRCYAGSVRMEPSRSMRLGTELHEKLEMEVHPVIEVDSLMKFIEDNWKQIKEGYDVDGFGEWEMETNNNGVAMDWSDSIIDRLYALIMGSEAREVLLHGYLDMNVGKFVTAEWNLSRDSSVLVSGVVDLIKLSSLKYVKDDDLFAELNTYVEANSEVVDDVPLVDLQEFFLNAGNILSDFKYYQLSFSDIKTSTRSRVPLQDSVLRSAEFQTFYYRHLFEVLGKDPKFTYYSLLENATRRGYDIDKPLSVVTTFKILRKHYHLFYEDFIKLANGKPIGFQPYDSESISEPYHFGHVFQTHEDFSLDNPKHDSFIESLREYDAIDYNKLLVPLLKTWKTPPTLRYLAARAAQFYHLLGNNIGDTTTVEYRNSITSDITETMTYTYDPDEFAEELYQATKFWNGQRDPIPTNDNSRCTYCDFKSKCSVSKIGVSGGEETKKLGPKIRQFLNECKTSSKGS
ncbi:EXO5 Exonuclease V [Candida maltosa Xu316]